MLLANWLHVEGEDGDERVLSWFDGTGCDGWVVQRELAAPEDYVTAWLRDTDETASTGLRRLARLVRRAPGRGGRVRRRRAAEGRPAAHGDARRRPAADRDRPGARRCGRHFARMDALAGRPARRRAGGCARTSGCTRSRARGDDGWYADSQLLQQEAGLRWSGGVDSYGATLLAGCDGTRPMGALLSVLASSTGLTDDEAAEQVLPVVRRLVEQGFLVP